MRAIIRLINLVPLSKIHFILTIKFYVEIKQLKNRQGKGEWYRSKYEFSLKMTENTNFKQGLNQDQGCNQGNTALSLDWRSRVKNTSDSCMKYFFQHEVDDFYRMSKFNS